MPTVTRRSFPRALFTSLESRLAGAWPLLLFLACMPAMPLAAQTAQGVVVQAMGSGFSSPFGVTVSASGNIYIADTSNNAVKEIPAGSSTAVTLVSPAGGYSFPQGVAVDASGNIYVADTGNNAVEKIPVGGGAATVLATGFNHPQGIAVDASGNVYVADTGNSAVKVIPSGGGTPTALGNGFSFNQPQGVAVDSSGNLYIADSNNDAIEKIAAPVTTISSVVTLVSGLSQLYAITLDSSNNIYVAENGSSAVQEVLAGASAVSNTVASGLSQPQSIAIGPNGTLYAIATSGTLNEIYRSGFSFPATAVSGFSNAVTAVFTFTASGSLSTTTPYVVLAQGAQNLDFQAATVQASTGTCAAGTTYSIGDTCTVNVVFAPMHPGQRIGAVQLNGSAGTPIVTCLLSGTGNGPQVIFPSNTTLTPLATTGTSPVQSSFSSPWGVAVDGNGNIYIADITNKKVQELVATDGVVSPTATPITLASGFGQPYGIAIDGAGNVYVSDTTNSTLSKLVAVNGAVPQNTTPVTLATESTPTADYLFLPTGIAVDTSGNVYIARPTAILEWVASTGLIRAVEVGLDLPYGIALDASGDLYIVDEGVAQVKMVPATNGAIVPGAAATLLSSAFTLPYGIALDSNNNVYIADAGNNAVMELAAASNGVVAANTTPISVIGADVIDQPHAVAVDASGNVYIAGYGGSSPSFVAEMPFATPPSLTFTPTDIGSSNAPQTVTVGNDGNEALTFPALSSSQNPNISTNFELVSPGTCPQISSGATTAGMLAANATCTLSVNIEPVTTGNISGTLVLTDTALNANPSTTQTINLNGGGVATVPGVPTIGIATGGNGQATVTFTPPASDGGDAITSYSVVAWVDSASGIPVTGIGSPIVVTGLTNGTTYTFNVFANNILGPGNPSAMSNSVTPATVPDAPTIGTATAGILQASVSFTPPANNGGAAITGYTVTSSPGSITATGTASPITVTGLTAGTAYTFTVTATNPLGTGPASAPSNSVTALAIPNYVVNDTGDDATGTASNCPANGATTGSGNCTLRDAIAAANAATVGNITFSTTVFPTSAQTTIQLTPSYGSLTISGSNVTVIGPGTNVLTVNGNGSSSRPLSVFTVNTGATATLYGVTITGGYASNNGGGVYNKGTLTILDSAISGNTAQNNGGGIENQAGTLTVENSTVSGNAANNDGGGIDNEVTGATASIVESTIYNNSLAPTGDAGAGISNRASMTIMSSTIWGNSCSQFTVSPGGGIYDGGGALVLSNSIVAGNNDQQGGANISGTYTGTGDVIGGSSNSNTSLVNGTGATITMSGLQYNGLNATVQTLIPLPGSPAICAGETSLIPSGTTTDERGYPLATPAYCTSGQIDAGAVQTNYTSLAFVQQPSALNIGAAMTPAPTVEAMETDTLLSSNNTDAVLLTNYTPSLILTDGGGYLESGWTQSLTSGVVALSGLTFSAPDSTDTLTAELTVSPSAAATPVTISGTSSQFVVEGPPAATIAISSTVLTVGQTGVNFTPVTGSGGTGTLSYSITIGILPTGLSFNASTGAITGSPTVASTATTFTVTVKDTNNLTATANFSLAVNAAVTATTAIASTTLTQNHAATSFIPVTGAGGTGTLSYAITAGTLPAGLSFNTSTGAISGTPTATLTATTFTVMVTDTNGVSASSMFVLIVNSAVTATAAVASTALTQSHAATSFIPVTGAGGTGTLSYAITTGTLPAGLNFNASTGAITGTSTATLTATTFTVTVKDVNGATASNTFVLTVNSAVTATTAVASTTLTQNHAASSFISVAGAGGTGTLSYAITTGTLPAGLSFSTSMGAITGTPAATLTATTFTVTVTDTNGATATANFSLTVSTAVTATTAIASTVLTQNHAITSFIPVTGGGGTGTLTYAITAGTLPTGLSFNTTTGAITGTPAATLTATMFTVTVTDTNGATATANFSLTVSTAVTATTAIASTVLTQNHAATSFIPVTGSGGTPSLSYAITTGTLPTGLSFNTTTGAITGTPMATLAATTFTVTVTDANGATTTASFSLTVNTAVAATTAITSTVLTQNHSVTSFIPVTGSGGTPSLSYAITIGTLPTGLSFNTLTGAIIGIPTATLTTTNFTVTVTDANGATATVSFSLTVNAAVTAATVVASTALTQNHAITSFTPVTGSGGTGTLTYSITTGTLPTGLIFSTSTGTISGTPTSTLTTTTFTVTVTDTNGATVTANFSLTVKPAVVATTTVASTTLTTNQTAMPFTPVTGSGGTSALSYALTSGTLPTGLSFNTSTGAITGTPAAAMVATQYTVTVTDANGATASANFSLTVQSIAPTVSSVTAVTSPYGVTTGIVVTATESGTAGAVTGGVVTFGVTGNAGGSFNAATCTLTSAGICTTTYTPSGTLAAGTYTGAITASFGAVGSYLATSGNNTLTISTIAPATATVSSVSTSYSSTTGLAVTATESGSGGSVTGGVVTFGVTGNIGGSFNPATCTLTSSNTCTTTYTPSGTLAAGTYASDITASFGAVGNYATASAVSTLSVGDTSQTITFTPTTPVTYGVAPITLAATGGASGNLVTFTLNSGPATLSGSTLAVNGAGAVSLTANQAGNANYNAATAVTATIVVNKATPAISLTPSVSALLVQNPVTLTATVSSTVSTPTGSVTFLDGSTPLGTVQLTSGVAVLTTSSLAVGAHSITAVSSGDNNFVAVTTTATSVLVADLNLAFSGVSSQTILPGGTASYSFTLSPSGAAVFPASVTLSVSGLPTGATYSFNPSSTIASGAGATDITLTITVPQQTAMLHQPTKLLPFSLATLLLLSFAETMRRKSRKLPRLCTMLLLLIGGAVGMTMMTGCGTGNGFLSQPQQSYPVTITITSGALTHTATVTLTVE